MVFPSTIPRKVSTFRVLVRNTYVAEVHRAFDSSRLVRSLEVPGQGIAVLHDLDCVRARLPVVAMGVDHPGAGDVCRGMLLRWQLLGKSDMAQRQQ